MTIASHPETTIGYPPISAAPNGAAKEPSPGEWLSEMTAYARGAGHMVTVRAVITPSLACALLERNEANRPVSKKTVTRFKTAILKGEWRETHQAIAITRSGRLGDGQHRCHAIVAADTAVPSLITFGMDDSAFTAIDIGKVRNGGDVFSVMGVKYATSTQAATRTYLTTDYARSNGIGFQSAREWVSTADVVSFYNSNSELIEPCMELLVSARSRFKFATAGFGACLIEARVAGWSHDTLDAFCNGIATGLDLSGDEDPIFLFRQHFINRETRYWPHYQMALAIKAFNAWTAKRPVKLLKFSEREVYPVVVPPRTLN